MPKAIIVGATTVGTTAVVLHTGNIELKEIVLKCPAGNADDLWIGSSLGVTETTGFVLDATEEVTLRDVNLSSIFILGGAAGQIVQFIAVPKD